MSDQVKENRPATSMPEPEAQEGGLSAKAPAFQLMASPGMPPIQRQVPPNPPPAPPAGPPTQTGGARREDRLHTQRLGLMDPFSGDHQYVRFPQHRHGLEEDIVNPQHRWDGTTPLAPTFNDGVTVTETGYRQFDTGYNASITVGTQTFSIEAYHIEGTSNERAMIVGGIHGTERGGVEIAERLLENFRNGTTPRPYYNLLLIPRLMPHNYDGRDRETNVARPAGEAATAPLTRSDGASLPAEYRGHLHDRTRRRTDGTTETVRDTTLTDPNRQAPALGQGMDHSTHLDAESRPMEPELVIMTALFDRYHPSRIVMLHGIRDRDHGGIYADPRADASENALDYTPDRDLTLRMAQHAEQSFDSTRFGNRRTLNVVPGNGMERRMHNGAPVLDRQGRYIFDQTHSIHRTIYPGVATPSMADPDPAPVGTHQDHTDNNGRSFGSWFSMAVGDPSRPDQNRPAVTTLTLETPGYGRSEDLRRPGDRDRRRAQMDALVSSLQEVFLGPPAAAPAAAPAVSAPPTTP